MKKHLGTSVAVACAAMALAGTGLIGGGETYAAGGAETQRIYVFDSSTSTSCELYRKGSTPDCDASYGSYSVQDGVGVITLGTGVNGKTLNIVEETSSLGETYKIKAASNIEAGISTPSKARIVFDLGNYSWTQTVGEKNFTFLMPVEGDTVIESGTFNFTGIIDSNNLTINGGVINNTLGSGGVAGTVQAKKIVMNDGTLDIRNGSLKVYDSAEVNGGNISIKSQYGLDGCITLQGDSASFSLNGGIVTIDAENSAKSGISNLGGENTAIVVSGGELNINNTEYGISLTGEGSKVYFNGGVTKIKNSAKYAIDLRYSDDPEHAIVFADDMGVMEPEVYIFWTEDDGWTGITEGEVVTIAEGGTVKKYHGWDIGDGDNEVNVDGSIKVPDTGRLSVENGGAVMAMVSLGVLAMIASGAYVAAYVAKRKQTKVNFNK